MGSSSSRRTIFRLAMALAGSLLVGCSGWNDYSNLITQVKKTPAEDWHALAAQLLERSKTNSASLPVSEWPVFACDIVRKVPATNWELSAETNSMSNEPHATLVSLGGFQCISVDFGLPSFVETEGPQNKVTPIYPGVYVRRSR
jgi:hypothetical protein